MRLDLAVIALTLFTGSSASVIGVRNGVDFSAVDEHDLFKRRGGGGGGSRGGGGSSSSGSSGSRGGSSGSSSSGSSSSGSSSSGSSGSSSSGSRGGSSSYGSSSYGSSYGSSSGSSSSNRGSGPGGTFRAPPGPALSGGRYPGGAVRPVNAGSRLAGGLAPLALGAGVGLAIVATAWAFSAWHNPYLYQYNNPYYYHDPRTNKNESMPIVCVCEDNHPCGCDDLGNNQNYGYMTQIIGNSSVNTVNNSQVAVGRNSNKGNETTLFVNGTLDGDEDSGAAHSIAVAGFWPVAATVFAIVFVL